MLKSITGFLSVLCLLGGCAMPESASTQSSAGTSVASTGTDAPVKDDDQDYDTVYVPPPVGSHLGGGYVRVPKATVSGTGEKALLSSIRHLNAAAGTQAERPFVVSAVSRVTGVSERELQAQQDLLRLRFGELCAINAIARGNSDKVKEIASMKSKGQSWTDVAKANGLNIATVAKTTQNASELTESAYSNSSDRREGGARKMNNFGRPRPNVPPGG